MIEYDPPGWIITMKNQIILLDIEGTITNPRGDNSTGVAILQTKLSSLEASGGNVILCSGRDLVYIQRLREAWNLSPTSPAISENGCEIFDGTNQFTTFEGVDYSPVKIRELLSIDDILDKAEFDPAKKYMVTLYPKGFSGGVSYTQNDIFEILDLVKPRLSDLQLNITYSSASVDIMPDGVDKLHGFQALANQLGNINPKNCLFFGDSMNDLELGKYIHAAGGKFCVPANALDELKHAADHVSTHKYAEGVLDILTALGIIH